MKPKYLTKSRFKLALECPTKLYYEGNSRYANQNLDDSFLRALADGGFQVGELAKCYIPGGHEIFSRDYEEAVQQTLELLEQEQVVIYEAAFRYENLFVRVDILRKAQQIIELIEVKAKSFDGAVEQPFYNKNGTLVKKMKPYLYDAAFQKHVLKAALPQYEVSAFLMMADKSSLCPTDGLNRKFKLVKDRSGRRSVVVSPDLTAADLETPILRRVNVDDACELIYNEKFGPAELSFAEYVVHLADFCRRGEKIRTAPSSVCGNCEFRATEAEAAVGLKNGFQECWREGLGWAEADFAEPTVLKLWGYLDKEGRINEGRAKISDLTEADVEPKSDDKPGLSASERRWLQVRKVKSRDTAPWFDAHQMSRELVSWSYPLHFIDFETSMAAIPFNKGRHPYEGVAFQFSHHLVHEDGRVEHRGQYLNAEPGLFPNYDFIRRLKCELEQDEGSIFRYSNHENTYLNIIYRQLRTDKEQIADRDELCQFIRTITSSPKESADRWTGQRSMIDMCELVKRYHYDPATEGSNSIKYVLPAVLNSSRFVQQKYSRPIYGAAGGIPSLNFTDWSWIKFADGQVVDPYKLLPKMFQDISDKDFAILSDDDELREGGSAMTAYVRMQFEEMSGYERAEISKALLKYCELDTFAMVMLYEAWMDMVRQQA